MKYQDYYKTLGVEKTASDEEIKKSYRKMARKYHPDVSKAPDAEQKFKEVSEAYEVLKNPEKRREYDNYGSNRQSNHRQNGFNTGFGSRPSGGFNDFFDSMFSSSPPVKDGENTSVKIYIDLLDSYQGATRNINLGNGNTIQVKIPAGIIAGQKIRLKGKGKPGRNGGAAGDLLLEIQFNKHPVFQINKADLTTDLLLTPWEAALGAKVKVPTMDGYIDIKIAPNTKAGQKIRLKGKGLPYKVNGDLYLKINLTNPKEVDTETAKLYEEMAKINNFNPRS